MTWNPQIGILNQLGENPFKTSQPVVAGVTGGAIMAWQFQSPSNSEYFNIKYSILRTSTTAWTSPVVAGSITDGDFESGYAGIALISVNNTAVLAWANNSGNIYLSTLASVDDSWTSRQEAKDSSVTFGAISQPVLGYDESLGQVLLVWNGAGEDGPYYAGLDWPSQP